ncbi:MAG: cytochrome P450 [Ktedonobacteraceae bacterium]|nr:cytochrome P450 [Ktedonobacteraceae bacterium]
MSHMIPTTPETKSKDTRRSPGPRTLSPLGSAPALARDTEGFAFKMWQRYGDLVRIRFLLWPGYLLYHPDHVKYVLHDHHRNYDKQSPLLNSFRFFFGNGLFTNNGESWLHQRRLMQPAFHHKRLAHFGTIMTDTTLAMLEHWQSAGSQPLDIPLEMTRLTLRIAGLTLFNLDLSNDADLVGHTFSVILPHLTKYSFLPFPPLWVPTPGNRRIIAGRETLNQVVYDIISQRRKHLTDSRMETGDLLSMLLAARDEETGEGMNDQQVRDEVMTLLLAGHETTSAALTWIWYLLSEHPEVEQRLHEEVDRVLGGQPPTVDRLDDLPYTRRVIQETMRLYPPAFFIIRHTKADDEIGGYPVPANSIIFLMAHQMHRHPAIWEEPERFDPERFTPERSASRPRFAYIPFGGGPRICIGNSLAMMEAQLVLATVVQQYSLRLVPGHPVEPQMVLTTRPRHGLPMTLHPR